jgi:hypothetical protein
VVAIHLFRQRQHGALRKLAHRRPKGRVLSGDFEIQVQR